MRSTVTEAHLYEDVAARVEGLIADGTLQPGDRIPSIRGLHRKWSVSVSTVLEAYRLLEDRGLVEARPKSGYYVRLTPRRLLEEPVPSKPPKRARRVEGSLAYRLLAEVVDPDVVKLGAAVPQAELLPVKALNRLIGQALRDAPERSHGYAMDSGDPLLKKEIARRMVDAGCSLSPRDVVITCGAQEAVYLSLRALTRPGDTVIVESPTYYGLLETLEVLELKALAVRTHPREGIDLEALDDALNRTAVAAVALVTNHSNPLGAVMSDAKKRRLVRLLDAHEVPLVEDDVYGELPFEGARPKAVKAFDRRGRVLYCASFSKTISPGVRIGWSVPGKRYRERVARLKLVANSASPAAPQIAIASFLREGGYDRHLRRLRAAYRENVRQMTARIALDFPPGTRCTRPMGGHLLWVAMPKAVDAMELQEEAAAHGISVAPGPMFSADGRYRSCMRLNAGLVWGPNVDSALRTLGRLATRAASRSS